MLPRLHIFTLRKASPLFSAVRQAHWNKDWRAGPYPRTEEERLAAAKKYNLLPEEYEPYPDDGDGYGDYPKLPSISEVNRDHFYPWTNPEVNRDYGEPLHIYWALMTEDRIEWPYTDPMIWGISGWKALGCFLSMVAFSTVLLMVPQQFNFVHFEPKLARHMPGPGKVHYHYPKKE